MACMYGLLLRMSCIYCTIFACLVYVCFTVFACLVCITIGYCFTIGGISVRVFVLCCFRQSAILFGHFT